jgi:hypothetical protein
MFSQPTTIAACVNICESEKASPVSELTKKSIIKSATFSDDGINPIKKSMHCKKNTKKMTFMCEDIRYIDQKGQHTAQ